MLTTVAARTKQCHASVSHVACYNWPSGSHHPVLPACRSYQDWPWWMFWAVQEELQKNMCWLPRWHRTGSWISLKTRNLDSAVVWRLKQQHHHPHQRLDRISASAIHKAGPGKEVPPLWFYTPWWETVSPLPWVHQHCEWGVQPSLRTHHLSGWAATHYLSQVPQFPKTGVPFPKHQICQLWQTRSCLP